MTVFQNRSGYQLPLSDHDAVAKLVALVGLSKRRSKIDQSKVNEPFTPVKSYQ